MDYPVVIAPLSEEDGGGYVGYAPDLVGCMGDGDTPEAALADTLKAVDEWLETARQRPGFPIPVPGSLAEQVKADRQAMAALINSISARHEEIDGRLDELQAQIQEIQERLDDAESWDRFSQIIGQPLRITRVTRLIAHRR